MGFSAAQAARITGTSRSQLEHWARVGLVVPDARGEYSRVELIALRVVGSLLDAGLPPARVGRALRYLVAAGDGATDLRLLTDGATVWACRSDRHVLDALRRLRLVLVVAVDRFAEEVEVEVRAFDAERRAFVSSFVGAPVAEATTVR